MDSRFLFAIATVAVLGMMLLAIHVDRADAASSIDVGDSWFCDSSFQLGVCETTVPLGTTITWTWAGSINHNVTECGPNWANSPSCPGTSWASATQVAGFYARQFDTEGDFYYLCTLHANLMRGKITVSGIAVGGVSELPDLAATSLSADEPERDRALLIGAVTVVVLASIAVYKGIGLILRRA